jgi:hypothetical protein
LKGVAAGIGGVASAGGCATLSGLSLPGELEISEAEVAAHVHRIDRGLRGTDQTKFIGDWIPPAKWTPELERDERLVRKMMRSMYVTGMFQDLPDDGRMHPAVQYRVFAALPEMDEAFAGVRDRLAGLSPRERAAVRDRLRADRTLGARVMERVEAQGMVADIPVKRRLHLRAMLNHAAWRLRNQPTALIIDEYLDKVKRIEARVGSGEETRRLLVARMGEQAFWQYQEKLFGAQRKWQAQGATAMVAGPPDRNATSVVLPSQGLAIEAQPAEHQHSGMGAIRTGGWMMGIGALVFGISVAAINASAGFLFTASAGASCFAIGFLVLIIGGIIYAATDS